MTKQFIPFWILAFAVGCSAQSVDSTSTAGAAGVRAAAGSVGVTSGGAGALGSAGASQSGVSGGSNSGETAGVGGAGGSTGVAGSAGNSAAGGSAAGGSAGYSTSGGSAGYSTSGGTGMGGTATTGGTAGSTNDAVVDTKKMAAEMGFGTNIGNTFDNTTTWETGWGEPLVTQAYINGMASRGIKTVRVPVAWDTYAAHGVIDATKMARVKQVVNWIAAAGMYSIVNIHWDGGWIDNGTANNPNQYKLTDDVKTKFASYWTQIATAFSDVGHQLIFEGLNEESAFYLNGDTTMPDYAALNTLNQLFVTTERAQAGYSKTRALLIAGFVTDIAKTCVSAFAIPTDPAGSGKLFLSIHYYTPYTFCGLDTVESWGSPQTTWGTASDKSDLVALFTQLATFSTQRNIPVILGEFGVTLGTNYPRDPASRTLWMESVAQASLTRNIVPVLWDTGSEISRTDGSFAATFKTIIPDLKTQGLLK